MVQCEAKLYDFTEKVPTRQCSRRASSTVMDSSGHFRDVCKPHRSRGGTARFVAR